MSPELSIALNCITILCGIHILINSARSESPIAGMIFLLLGLGITGWGIYLLVGTLGVAS